MAAMLQVLMGHNAAALVAGCPSLHTLHLHVGVTGRALAVLKTAPNLKQLILTQLASSDQEDLEQVVLHEHPNLAARTQARARVTWDTHKQGMLTDGASPCAECYLAVLVVQAHACPAGVSHTS